MIFKGLRFGMLLQLAVGPMCLMVFNTSITHGLFMGFSLVLAIASIDALFIALSGAGIAAVMNREKIKTAIKIFGCMVLVLFGANTIASAFDISFVPSVSLISNVTSQNIFIQGLILTASNPLTIIFWGGVFSTQIIENKLDKTQLFFFGSGCVLSTLIFLTLIALLGNFFSGFLPLIVIQILNMAVGILLIYFGIRLVHKKQ